MAKRSHDEMTGEGERDRRSLGEAHDDLICLERWPREKLAHLRDNVLLPQELKDRLDAIRLESGVDRIKVRYSTGRGDPYGRVYGSLIYYSDWYKKREGSSYDYMSNHPRDYENDGGRSLQNMDKWIRRLLAHENYRDFDMVNAAPTLLAQIIEKEGLTVPPELVAYNTNREAIFARYKGRIDLAVVKTTFLKVLHMGGEDDRIPETVRLKYALRTTLLTLATKNDRYKALYEKSREEALKDSKKSKFSYLKDNQSAITTKSLGKLCAAVWQREEHRVLMSMRAYFVSQGYPAQYMVLCFDGMQVERRDTDATDVVNFDELSDFIHQNTGFRVKIVEKSLKPTESDLAIYEGREFYEKRA